MKVFYIDDNRGLFERCNTASRTTGVRKRAATLQENQIHFTESQSVKNQNFTTDISNNQDKVWTINAPVKYVIYPGSNNSL